MSPVPRRVVVSLLVAAALCAPAAASAQTSTLPGEGSERAAPSELPNTGADPRMLFLAGLALTLMGFGLRLRTADADEY